jgi:RNA polymerase sigma-70 factor (ECF subfamily)
VGGWLQAVLRNCCLLQLRRGRHEVPSDQLEMPTSAPGPEEAMEQLALRSWIWTALEAIGEEERLTLLLRHFTRCQSHSGPGSV